MVEKFNFETMNGCEERKSFYKENWDKQITESEFIKAVSSWPKRGGKANDRRKPSSAKSQYRRLRQKFGFFPTETE